MNSRIICLMLTMYKALCKKLNKYLIILLISVKIIFNGMNYFTGTMQTFYSKLTKEDFVK